jgi:hypothetical protein
VLPASKEDTMALGSNAPTRTVGLLQESILAASIPRLVGRAPTDPVLPGIGNGLFRGGSRVRLDLDRAGTTGIVVVLGANRGDSNSQPSTIGGSPTTQRFKGDGATVAFQTQIPYVAQSGYNWIVQSSAFVLAGTVVVTANSATITGTSTAFLADLRQGDIVRLGTTGELARILSIQSDTVAIADTVFTTAASGVTITSVGSCLPVGSITMSSGPGALALCTLGVAPASGAIIEVNYAAVETLLTVPAANSRKLVTEIATRDYMWTTLSGSPSATTIVLEALK